MNQRVDRPWVHVGVDVSVRELDGKLLLAATLLSSGFNVSVFRLGNLARSLELLPRGVIIDTRFNGPRYEFNAEIRSMGYRLVAFDEEATNISDKDFYQRNFVSPKTLSLSSAAFCWGDYHADAVREALPSEQRRVVSSTGHPRFDILRKECREFFTKQVAALRRAHGQFILFNSNSDNTIHTGDIEGLWRKLTGRGSIIDSDKNRRRFFAYQQYRIQRHRDLVSLIKTVSKAFPKNKIIIRPKYNETFEQWRAWLPEKLGNVQILHEGSAVPWMMASRVMLHSGCTTGTEAFLADVPVISYLREFRVGFDTELPNRLSTMACKEDDVVDLLRRAVKDDLATPAQERACQEALADIHVSARRGPLASESIAAVLKGLGFSYADDATRLQKALANSERVGLVDGNGLWREERMHRQSTRPRKSAGLSYEGIGHRLNKLFLLVPNLEPIAVTQMPFKTFLLTRALDTQLPRRSGFWSRLRSTLRPHRGVA